MTTTSPAVRITTRDLAVLLALDRVPLTVSQIRTLSETFPQPFRSVRRVQERLQQLRSTGLLGRFPYGLVSAGTAPAYHRLTLAGYRVLHGPAAEPPARRHFAEIGLARHHHTKSLADLLVRLLVAAHVGNVQVTEFAGENTLALHVGTERLFPDAAFTLRAPWSPIAYRFFVELDCGTERLRSQKECDSIARKVRLYEEYRERSRDAFRVLFVTTRSRQRLAGLRSTAFDSLRDPSRGLVHVGFLPDVLDATSPLLDPVFQSHWGKPATLLPPDATPASTTTPAGASLAA